MAALTQSVIRRPDGPSGAVTTTDSTQTVAATLPLANFPDSTQVVNIVARIVALNTDGSQGAGYVRAATVRNNAGTPVLVGSVTAVATHEDNSAWDATLDVNSTNVRVLVTGAASTTINWQVDLKVIGVTT